jgi:RHS repeat-associated protein
VGGVASTPTNRYVYASYIDEPVVRKAAGTSGTIHYYHRNQQYSITAMTTSTGAVAERYAYTAYGQPTILNASGSPIGNQQSQIANRFTYTGREWDETLGLHHFRARWMSPLAGRFLGRDPIGYSDGYNMFMLQFFLSSTDPTGLYTIGGDMDRMWGCLNANYVKIHDDISLPDSVRCPFVPLSYATQMRLVGVVGQVGVGVILTSVKHLMPEGLLGKITEAALENILSKLTCDPTNTEEQVKKLIYDQLKVLAGNYVDPQAIKALDLIAKQLAEKAFDECKGMTCEQHSFQHGPSAGYEVSCHFNLCKKRHGSTTTYSLSGTCSYKCIKSERCSCSCGTSITTHFSGISYAVEDSRLFSENCDNFSIGTTRILK